MREGRFRMIDLGMEEKTQIRTEVPESPIGHYLLDLEDNINYPLKDGWHFDILKDGKTLTYFTIRFQNNKLTVHTEIPEYIYINYMNANEFDDEIDDDAVLEFKDETEKDQFVLSKNRNLTVKEAKKIIGRYLVMSSDKARLERLKTLEKKLEELNSELSEVNQFFERKEELEKSIQGCPELIEQKKQELEHLKKDLIEKQLELDTHYSSEELENHLSRQKDIESEILNVNSQITKIKK